MVGWNLPYLFFYSDPMQPTCLPWYSGSLQKLQDPPAWAGRSWGEAPSLRLDFVDLPLVQGDQEGFKEVETFEGLVQVGIELAGLGPPSVFPYVPPRDCKRRARPSRIGCGAAGVKKSGLGASPTRAGHSCLLSRSPCKIYTRFACKRHLPSGGSQRESGGRRLESGWIC